MGNRIAKHITNNQTGVLEKSTYYILDAQGKSKQSLRRLNVSARTLNTYDHRLSRFYIGEVQNTAVTYTLKDRQIYGSSRLGIYDDSVSMYASAESPYVNLENGHKYYELSNHLGNVLTVIKDVKYPTSSNGTTVDNYEVAIVNIADHSPFGVQLDGRTMESDSYRYGFQGREKDDEIKGSGNSYTTHFRQLDPRVGRWLSIDPKKSAWESPYVSMNNNPIKVVDLKGDTTDFYDISTGAFIGTLNDDGVRVNVKVKADFARQLVGTIEADFRAGFMDESTAQDKENYKSEKLLSLLDFNEELLRGIGEDEELIASPTGNKDIYVFGSMRSDLLADVLITVREHFDDGSILPYETFEGTAGGFGNGPPENGSYTVDNYQDRSATGWYNAGMNRDGIGFSYNLNPNFTTSRTLLRIHPDGNNEGTLGCLGLGGNANALNLFRRVANDILSPTDTDEINLNINILNNPNNDGSSGTTSTVNE